MTRLNSESTNGIKNKILKLKIIQSLLKYWKYLKYGVIALSIFLLAWSLSCIPRYFINSSKPIKDDYALTGTIGDTYGGLLGPPIAFIAAILTFAAFWVQYKANQQQRADIDSQSHNWLYERCESRFFELLKLHKENVADMQVGDFIGRKCFGVLFEEFRLIFEIILDLQVEISRTEPEYDGIDTLNVAYHCFFHGVNNHGAKAFMDDFKGIYRTFYERPDGIFETLEPSKTGRTWVVEKNRIQTMINEWHDKYHHSPFGGHADMLGHYYRHMYQTVNYVINNDEILKPHEKFEFIRTFRAQLTNSEQLMLYYNGATWYPDEWRKIFTTYRFIKNIPLELCELGLNPFVIYEEEMIKLYVYENNKRMFEGQGDINGMVNQWKDENPNWKDKTKEYFDLKWI